VIDKAGKLRQITVNDLPVGRDVDETLRLVQVLCISTFDDDKDSFG
jgi:alkyl hydroperoxide reductase subunit AhpC